MNHQFQDLEFTNPFVRRGSRKKRIVCYVHKIYQSWQLDALHNEDYWKPEY